MAREQFMVEVEFIHTEAARASDAVLGAWTRLNAYMAPRLLGGRLPGAKRWDNDTAMRMVQITRDRMDEMVAAELAEWSGDDLLVAGFDFKGQSLWIAKSSGGHTGKKRQEERRRSTKNTGTPTATPSGTPTRDSRGDSQPGEAEALPEAEPEGDPPGLPQGDSDSDCESDSENPTTATARERDPRVVVAVALGASLRGIEADHPDLEPRWLAVIGSATVEQVRAVFAAAPRLLGYELRYPGKFQQVLKALQVEEESANAEAQREAREQAKRDDDDRCQRIRRGWDQYFATPEGKALWNRLTEVERDTVKLLRDGVLRTGTPGLKPLADKYPSLKAAALEALRTAEVA